MVHDDDLVHRRIPQVVHLRRSGEEIVNNILK